MGEGTAADQAARYTAKLDAEGFLAWLFASLWTVYQFTRWLDTRRLPFPGAPDRECDTIAEWKHRKGEAGPMALIVEFQTRPEARLAHRLAAYALHVEADEPFQREHPVVRYTVQSAVVFLTGRSNPVLTHRFAGLGLGSVTWEFPAFCLETLDAADELGRIERGEVSRCVLPWMPLMAGADDGAFVERWKATADGERLFQKGCGRRTRV